jgi:hypothetical protein
VEYWEGVQIEEGIDSGLRLTNVMGLGPLENFTSNEGTNLLNELS